MAVARQHLRSLERFPFDAVLLPYNYADARRRYAARVEALVALCEERSVAVQTIKAITRGPWGGRARRRRPGTSR